MVNSTNTNNGRNSIAHYIGAIQGMILICLPAGSARSYLAQNVLMRIKGVQYSIRDIDREAIIYMSDADIINLLMGIVNDH